MPSYTTDPATYDNAALAKALRLIIRRSRSAATEARAAVLRAEASAALGVRGARRQMKYDILALKALKEAKFSPEEQAQIVKLIGRGRIEAPEAEKNARASVIHFQFPQEEEIASEIGMAGKSASELLREALVELLYELSWGFRENFSIRDVFSKVFTLTNRFNIFDLSDEEQQDLLTQLRERGHNDLADRIEKLEAYIARMESRQYVQEQELEQQGSDDGNVKTPYQDKERD